MLILSVYSMNIIKNIVPVYVAGIIVIFLI